MFFKYIKKTPVKNESSVFTKPTFPVWVSGRGQEHRSMISSMDEITMLLHSNHKTEPSILMQGLTGQSAVISRVGVAS